MEGKGKKGSAGEGRERKGIKGRGGDEDFRAFLQFQICCNTLRPHAVLGPKLTLYTLYDYCHTTTNNNSFKTKKLKCLQIDFLCVMYHFRCFKHFLLLIFFLEITITRRQAAAVPSLDERKTSQVELQRTPHRHCALLRPVNQTAESARKRIANGRRRPETYRDHWVHTVLRCLICV